MRTSCLRHPSDEPLIVIRQWQLDACGGNGCAATLLSFFEYWHNIKLRQQTQARFYNDTAERHGDQRDQYEGLLQWHSTEEIERGILIYRKDAIKRGIELLVELGFISVHSNPNPRYRFDKTRFFLFHPEKVQMAIDSLTANRSAVFSGSNAENRSRCAENHSRCAEISSPYTKTTYKTTNREESPPISPQGGEAIKPANRENYEGEQPTANEPEDKGFSTSGKEGALSNRGKKNAAAAPPLDKFLADFNLYAPARWVRAKTLTVAYRNALKRFVGQYGGDAHRLFLDGLKFAAQDKFLSNCDWDLCNWLTNDKPARYALRWDDLQAMQQRDYEEAQVYADRSLSTHERYERLECIRRRYGDVPAYWDEIIARVESQQNLNGKEDDDDAGEATRNCERLT